MTTRSGRGFKSPDMSTTEEITTGGVDVGPPVREDEEGGRGSPDAAVDVAAVVQMLIEDLRGRRGACATGTRHGSASKRNEGADGGDVQVYGT